ncbi:hypothetical protein D3C73_1212460 [compost metagenome]
MFTAEIRQRQVELCSQFDQARLVTFQVDTGQGPDLMKFDLMSLEDLVKQRAQRFDRAAALTAQADHQGRRCAFNDHAWF